MARSSVGALEISAYFAPRTFIDDFPAHCISNIGHPVASGREPASHVVNAFAEDNLNSIGTHTHNDDIQGLPGCRYANRNLVGVHMMVVTFVGFKSICAPSLCRRRTLLQRSQKAPFPQVRSETG